MSFPVEAPGRVNQLTYWLYFGGNTALTGVLLLGGIFAILTGSFGTGVVMLMLLLPVAIYFRVIMMRRCRDIGWPAFLPWAAFVALAGLGAVSGFPQKLLAGAGTEGAVMIGLVSLADFLLTIIIGCIGSKPYVEAPFQEPSAPVAIKSAPTVTKAAPIVPERLAPIVDQSPAPVSPIGLPDIPYPDMRNSLRDEPDYDRWDAAIAARLAELNAASQEKGNDPDMHHTVRASAPIPAPLAPRPATGFGRKVA